MPGGSCKDVDEDVDGDGGGDGHGDVAAAVLRKMQSTLDLASLKRSVAARGRRARQDQPRLPHLVRPLTHTRGDTFAWRWHFNWQPGWRQQQRRR